MGELFQVVCYIAWYLNYALEWHRAWLENQLASLVLESSKAPDSDVSDVSARLGLVGELSSPSAASDVAAGSGSPALVEDDVMVTDAGIVSSAVPSATEDIATSYDQLVAMGLITPQASAAQRDVAPEGPNRELGITNLPGQASGCGVFGTRVPFDPAAFV